MQRQLMLYTQWQTPFINTSINHEKQSATIDLVSRLRKELNDDGLLFA